MTIDLYYQPGSAPCRSVLLVAKALGVNLNLKQINLLSGEQLSPEFLKLNPEHVVPTLNDNGFVIWESRAILGYLADKYGMKDTLYPKDPKKRAMVDNKLFFDSGTLYQRYVDYYYSIIFFGKPADSEKMKRLEEAFGFYDSFLEKQDYAAGCNITIADFALVVTVSSADILGFNVSKYPNVAKWFAKMKKEINGYNEINHSGCVLLKVQLGGKLKGIK